MTNNELIKALKVAVGYDHEEALKGSGMYRIGSALSDDEFMKIVDTYKSEYYPRVRALIEKLPWISTNDMLPETDGDYLTLLDCNEHEIDVNHIRLYPDGNRHWMWCDRHVCYWMPIPEANDNEISWKPSKMDWHDGGQPMHYDALLGKFY